MGWRPNQACLARHPPWHRAQMDSPPWPGCRPPAEAPPLTSPPRGQFMKGAGTASSPAAQPSPRQQPGTRPSPPVLHELALFPPRAHLRLFQCCWHGRLERGHSCPPLRDCQPASPPADKNVRAPKNLRCALPPLLRNSSVDIRKPVRYKNAESVDNELDYGKALLPHPRSDQ